MLISTSDDVVVAKILILTLFVINVIVHDSTYVSIRLVQIFQYIRIEHLVGVT